MKLGAGRDESEFKLAPPPQRRPLSNPHAELAEGDGRAGEAGMNRGRCRGGDKGQTVKEKIGRTAPSDVVGPQVSVLLAMKKIYRIMAHLSLSCSSNHMYYPEGLVNHMPRN